MGDPSATDWCQRLVSVVVKFTDGTKFDADVAAQNVIRFRDGASPNKSLLASVADAKSVNPTTLEITLKESDPALLIALTQNAGYQESPKAFGAADIKQSGRLRSVHAGHRQHRRRVVLRL
jgi:ABC-type transport system substrate-binding protein